MGIPRTVAGVCDCRDAATGALITSLRSNACPSRCIAPIQLSYVAACQSNSAKMRFWTWNKGRCIDSILPEKCTSVCINADGTYLFAGGKSGRLYVWEFRTGRLMHSWNAHYRAVGNLKVDDRGYVIVSGGEDAVVHVWLMPEVIDPEPGKAPVPYRSWSGHTLPVTDFAIDSTGAVVTIVSVSKDCTCQLWGIASEKEIRTETFPCPLLSVALGSGWDKAVYCGGENGEIYETKLTPSDSSSMQSRHQCFCHRHDIGVVSLAMTPLSERLVSGSLDGSVRIWDVVSRLCLRVMELPGKKPVSNVFTLFDPEGRVTDKDAVPPPPLVGLNKFPGAPLKMQGFPWEGAPIELKGKPSYSGIAHIVLNPSRSSLDSIVMHGAAAQEPRREDSQRAKVPLEGGASEADVQHAEMLESLNPTNLDVKSFVAQVLMKDRMA